MKLCVAQTKPFTGDIESNIKAHKKLIALAIVKGAGMIIFPELSITGYEPAMAKELATTPDDNRFDEFQQLSDQHNIIIGIGVPTKKRRRHLHHYAVIPSRTTASNLFQKIFACR